MLPSSQLESNALGGVFYRSLSARRWDTSQSPHSRMEMPRSVWALRRGLGYAVPLTRRSMAGIFLSSTRRSRTERKMFHSIRGQKGIRCLNALKEWRVCQTAGKPHLFQTESCPRSRYPGQAGGVRLLLVVVKKSVSKRSGEMVRNRCSAVPDGIAGDGCTSTWLVCAVCWVLCSIR
jgi:hypothetical protein